MFYGKNKIMAFSVVILLVVVLLGSLSFSTRVSKVSGSFACTTTVAVSPCRTDIVEAVADISVKALTAGIAGGIEDSIESSTVEIYNARIAEERAAAEARAAEIAMAKAKEAQSRAAGANLNGLENEMLKLINKVRVDHGLSPLTVVQSLTDIARTRCQDMVSKGYFSHYSPDGRTFFNIMRDSNIGWTNAGENLGNATPASYGSPSAFINAWLGSPSHRDNMLRSNYRIIGIGIIDGGGRRVVTTIFLN